MKNILMVLLLSATVYAVVPAPCKSEEQMLREKSIDLDTKALKGWIRLLKNKVKMSEGNIALTKSQANDLIKCLTIELKNRQMAGKML